MGPELIVYFDGYCNLCNRWVDRILRNERNASFYFAPLTGRIAEERLPKELQENGPDAIVLERDGRFQTGPRAALAITKYLQWPYNWLRVLRILPSPLLEKGYKWVARNRYRWYGKREECRLPTASERSRFLD
jgi:predicted DCC family thiol-disulfide oxidoreductase YuxK